MATDFSAVVPELAIEHMPLWAVLELVVRQTDPTERVESPRVSPTAPTVRPEDRNHDGPN